MTRCPFALTTTCLLAGITLALMSAGQDADINKQVYRFLHHHVKNKHVRAAIEFATIRGGAYYGTMVLLAHVVGYLLAVNVFDISHAVAGKSLTVVLMGVVIIAAVVGGAMLATSTKKRPTTSETTADTLVTKEPHAANKVTE